MPFKITQQDEYTVEYVLDQPLTIKEFIKFLRTLPQEANVVGEYDGSECPVKFASFFKERKVLQI